MRVVKDVRLSLALTEVMKIARLKSLLLDVPRQPLPRPRLRLVRRLALLSHLGLTLKLFTKPEATSLSSAEPHACESHSSFCSPFTPAEFLAAASNISSSTATGPDKVAYPMLKHLPHSGMDFLLHIFNLSWSLHSFPSIWKTSSIIPIHKMGKPLDSRAFFQPISLTSCVSKLSERITLSRLLFFLESNSILSPRQAGFRPGRSTLDQILYLSQSISDGFNKPRPALRRFSLLLISLILLTLSGNPFFSINSFRLASFFALLVGLNLSFLIGALVWLFKITKVVPFESVEAFRKDPFLALYFSLYSLMIPGLSAFFRQLFSLR